VVKVLLMLKKLSWFSFITGIIVFHLFSFIFFMLLVTILNLFSYESLLFIYINSIIQIVELAFICDGFLELIFITDHKLKRIAILFLLLEVVHILTNIIIMFFSFVIIIFGFMVEIILTIKLYCMMKCKTSRK